MKGGSEKRHQLKLEKLRQDFERDKIAYKENASHLRALNQYLWQVPTIAVTLTGGLWFGVTKIDIVHAKVWLLSFAALADFILIFVILRVRFLFGQYLSAQRGFCSAREIKSESGPFGLPGWTVVICFSSLLLAASIGSIYGICNVNTLMSPTVIK